MATIPDQRFRSGEKCIEAGCYEFDGYLDGSSEELPGLGETEIWVSAGQRFPPPIGRQRKCYWKRAEEVRVDGDLTTDVP